MAALSPSRARARARVPSLDSARALPSARSPASVARAQAGLGDQQLESFDGSPRTAHDALQLATERQTSSDRRGERASSDWSVGFQPRLDDKPRLKCLLADARAPPARSPTDDARDAAGAPADAVAGRPSPIMYPEGLLPEWLPAVCDAFEAHQYLVLQPGPSGDLRPHVDYLATAVFYVLLQGTKTLHVWPPFSRAGGATNLRLLAEGFVDDRNVADELTGARYTFEVRVRRPAAPVRARALPLATSSLPPPRLPSAL